MTKTLLLRASLLGACVHAAFLLLPCQSAFAQPGPSAGEPAVTQGGTNIASASHDAAAAYDVTAFVPVTVTGATYDTPCDDTASRFVITQEELQKSGDTELSESIKRLLGATVDIGQAGAITLHGVGNGYARILLNGEGAPNDSPWPRCSRT